MIVPNIVRITGEIHSLDADSMKRKLITKKRRGHLAIVILAADLNIQLWSVTGT